jgi:cbb3-type cytochrome oxidase subunit 3
MFKKAPRINEFRCWVLRYAKKGNRDEPKYLYTVESQYEGKNLQSRCHAKYLLNFGVKVDLKKPYGPEAIETQAYNTGKRTEKDSEKKGLISLFKTLMSRLLSSLLWFAF